MSFTLTLDDSPLSDRIIEALPLESRVSTWGDEIYFPIPVEDGSPPLTREVQVGDVAYWPEGKSLAIFYGPTPLSGGDQPVPADSVAVIGRIEGPMEELDNVEAGANVRLQD